MACPVRGAECNGSSIRSVNGLDVLGAKWEADEAGRYTLKACPVGYKLVNELGYDKQVIQRSVGSRVLKLHIIAASGCAKLNLLLNHRRQDVSLRDCLGNRGDDDHFNHNSMPIPCKLIIIVTDCLAITISLIARNASHALSESTSSVPTTQPSRASRALARPLVPTEVLLSLRKPSSSRWTCRGFRRRRWESFGVPRGG